MSATSEDSQAPGVNGNQADNSMFNTGAVYAFRWENGTWVQHSYVKASSPASSDHFGQSLALSSGAMSMIVGAPNQDSLFSNSGAAYVYVGSP